MTDNSRAPHGAAEPDRAMEASELGQRIRDALAQLSPEHRAVILMKEIDGLSYQEIAETTGCQIGTRLLASAKSRNSTR